MKSKQIKKKPKYLALNDTAKKEVIDSIISSNLAESSKDITQECMLFAEAVEKELKSPGITLSKIKHLFELHAEKLKKLQLNQ